VSNKNSMRFLVVILSAAFATAALVLADSGVRAQNSNSSPPAEDSAQNSNANTAAPRRGRGRRGRRAAAPAATTTDTTTDAGTPAEPSNQMAVVAPVVQEGSAGERDLSGERADLSGTYTGRVVMTGGHEMSGEGTLTITGNTFTLAVDTMTHNGRVYAVTTRGYIGAAFYFPDIEDPATKTPVVANVRARKSGERLTLTPVAGTRTRLTFTSARR
jgi:hypothetical protein